MAHGAMLWGAALYNNGSVPFKDPRFGEFYTRDGAPGTATADPAPTVREQDRLGILPLLEPLFRWEIVAAGQRAADLRARRTPPDRRSASRIRTKNPDGRRDVSATADSAR